MPPIVECRKVRVLRGDTEALAGIDLDLAAGSIQVLLGPNGAGKTTLVDTITGLLAPTAGQVRVFGLDPATDRAQLAHRWGVMPQSGGLPMGATVGEAVQLFADLWGHGDRVPEVIDLCGLSALTAKRWRRLSGGQQQRVSLAVALLGGRELLVLDEPTAAVDHEGQADLLAMLRHTAEQGATVLLTTHDHQVAESIATDIILLNRGVVKASTTMAELRRPTDEVVLLVAAPPTDDQRRQLEQALATPVAVDGTELRVRTNSQAPDVARIGAMAADTGLSVRQLGYAEHSVHRWVEKALEDHS